MKSVVIRLFLAAILSLMGLASTLYYYRSTAPVADHATETVPIAFVKSVGGAPEARREGSRIWTPLQEGDLLYPGDSTRTGEQDEMKVQMIGKNAVLDLEAETSLSINLAPQSLALELLDGYVTVNQELDQRGPLLIKDGDQLKPLDFKKVFLTRESLSTLRLATNTSVDVENPAELTWRKPAGDFDTTLNPEDPHPPVFSWEGIQPNAKIAIEWGPTRKKLNQRSPLVPVNDGRLSLLLPIGRHYWRWTIYINDARVWTSPSARAVVQGLFPPALITPLSGQVIKLREPTDEIVFKWTPDRRFSAYHLEVAGDPGFTNMLARTQLKNVGSFPFRTPRLGTFYWRLSGWDTSQAEWLRTKTHEFRVLVKLPEKVDLRWLTHNNEVLHYLTAKPSAKIAWSAESTRGIQKYKVRYSQINQDVRRGSPIFTESTELSLKPERPGPYVALVEALNSEGEVIGQTSVLNFEIQPQPLLRAPAMAFAPTEPVKADARGNVQLNWQPVPGAREYIVELRNPNGSVDPFRTKVPRYAFQRLIPGQYSFRVTVIDTHGRIGERGESRVLIVPNKSAIKAIKVKKVEVQ